MLKQIIPTLAILLAACNNPQQQNEVAKKDSATERESHAPALDSATKTSPEIKTYSNDRFRKVVVEKTGEHKFLIKGEARVFEAAFSWVVEDGHEELKTGHEMTDAGAPEWGKFSFTVDVQKKRANSTLHLIIFESSPKDGSRQSELPILLY